MGAVSAALLIATPSMAQTFEASGVRLENFQGSANFVLTNRPGIRIAPQNAVDRASVEISLEGDEVVVRSVTEESGESALPSLEITLPAQSALTVAYSDAALNLGAYKGDLKVVGSRINGSADSARRAYLGLSAGSSFVIGNISEEADIALFGNADLLIERVSLIRALVNDVAGLTVGEVGQLLDVSIGGRGVVSIDKASGVLRAHIASEGVLTIRDGRLSRVQATLDGPGSLIFEGVTGDAELRLVSDASVFLTFVSGRVVRIGDGKVFIDGRRWY